MVRVGVFNRTNPSGLQEVGVSLDSLSAGVVSGTFAFSPGGKYSGMSDLSMGVA